MPYIRIKAYPKDQATKEKVVEAINKAASSGRFIHCDVEE